jgi:hypothetical protein
MREGKYGQAGLILRLPWNAAVPCRIFAIE